MGSIKMCVWPPLELKVCDGQHQNMCVWAPLGLKVCNGQHQNVCVQAPVGLKVCNGQHQNVCVWAPLRHILDLENGAGREEKKEASNTFVLYGLQKGRNLQIPIDESVCACLVVLFLGWCKLSFPFLGGLRQNSCSLWVA
jgi:hypothetical protein